MSSMLLQQRKFRPSKEVSSLVDEKGSGCEGTCTCLETPSTKKKRTATDAGFNDNHDDAPSMNTVVTPLQDEAPCCWLCLEEGPDESGESLVRDCSCRGSSGFVHLACLQKYAEHKGRQAKRSYNRYEDTNKAFKRCPNCHQDYQDGLRRAMMKARLTFVEKECNDYRTLLLAALMGMLNVLDAVEDRSEGGKMCSRILSVLREMETVECSTRRRSFVTSAAPAHNTIGAFHASIGSRESLHKAKQHRQIARDLYEEMGDKVGALAMSRNIDVCEAKLSGKVHRDSLKYLQTRYDYGLEHYGKADTRTIMAGVNLATGLRAGSLHTQAERLVAKLAETTRSIHGSDHRCTKIVTLTLQEMTKRYVNVTFYHSDLKTEKPSHVRRFQILRYENEECIVQGPVANPRNVLKERILRVSTGDIVPIAGTPLICYGLKGEQAHLNGKLVMRFHLINNGVCRVYFEEECLEPVTIMFNNLRIAFDLPMAIKEC